jgi:serine/threonine protein kinase
MLAIIDGKKQNEELPIKNKGKCNDVSIETTKANESDISALDEKDLKLKKTGEELKQHKNFGEKCEILSLIGSGSESDVYRTRIKGYKREFALKKIFQSKNKKINKNKKEIKIASKLKNKNIIDFCGYSACEKNNTEFIIMENAKYGNLRNFQMNSLKRICLPESTLCYFSFQILNGLAYMHKCKVAHMDIKPQNIVIDEYLNAKLIDFSISINYQGKQPNDELKLPFKGTNFYMPLEVLDEQKIKYKDLNKVDAFALGVLLYNLAFGCYPFGLTYEDNKDYKKISQKMKNELEINNPNNLSSCFIDFVTKLLEKDINKRMSIYEALQHPWNKGAQILMKEKENLYNLNTFVIRIITDNIKSFNDYVNQYDKK